MSDDFGIPANTFGPVPEPFYGALGRVVAMGALVEMRLAALLTTLDAVPQDEYAGLQVSNLLTKHRDRRNRLKALTTLPGDPIELLEDVRTTMERRNRIVHSLWPSPTLYSAKGWRAVVRRRRTDGRHVEWVETSLTDLRDLIEDLVSLASQLLDAASSASINEPAP